MSEQQNAENHRQLSLNFFATFVFCFFYKGKKYEFVCLLKQQVGWEILSVYTDTVSTIL